MKTILVPIDFTAAAEPTLAYANKLAVRWPAEIVLVYSQAGPELATEEREALKGRLETLAERLRYRELVRQDARRIRYSYEVVSGCLHDQVQALVARYGADLVVMGLEHTDCGKPATNGDNAVRITELVPCPVLVVPPGRRSLPTRMVYATDFGHLPLPTLPRLSALAGALPGTLELVQMYSPQQRGNLTYLKRAVAASKAQLAWPTITTKMVEDDDPIEGISDYCARTQAQLLILTPSSESELIRFFDKCYALTQAYHLQIPVLVLGQPAQQASTVCCERCAKELHNKSVEQLLVEASITKRPTSLT
ncbi:Nucleotide-binding universal stress protein, UspA family [Hymenobacter gelipurpurascens]|uniref:Nucleotide-binding universal stress protein, UspA family n=1 Tax=Hymenobacter gelipurpurascens TaxID=89968 RepID=A0A212T1P4_9BACT|nr:universal stress protein [Hymenobacter gelipurpurascens]SNC59935.1 Nucleotide-binding universal stress protein, UspA family [Hymenobacter gelipurpurascens]